MGSSISPRTTLRPAVWRPPPGAGAVVRRTGISTSSAAPSRFALARAASSAIVVFARFAHFSRAGVTFAALRANALFMPSWRASSSCSSSTAAAFATTAGRARRASPCSCRRAARQPSSGWCGASSFMLVHLVVHRVRSERAVAPVGARVVVRGFHVLHLGALGGVRLFVVVAKRDDELRDARVLLDLDRRRGR